MGSPATRGEGADQRQPPRCRSPISISDLTTADGERGRLLFGLFDQSGRMFGPPQRGLRDRLAANPLWNYWLHREAAGRPGNRVPGPGLRVVAGAFAGCGAGGRRAVVPGRTARAARGVPRPANMRPPVSKKESNMRSPASKKETIPIGSSTFSKRSRRASRCSRILRWAFPGAASGSGCWPACRRSWWGGRPWCSCCTSERLPR